MRTVSEAVHPSVFVERVVLGFKWSSSWRVRTSEAKNRAAAARSEKVEKRKTERGRGRAHALFSASRTHHENRTMGTGLQLCTVRRRGLEHASSGSLESLVWLRTLVGLLFCSERSNGRN